MIPTTTNADQRRWLHRLRTVSALMPIVTVGWCATPLASAAPEDDPVTMIKEFADQATKDGDAIVSLATVTKREIPLVDNATVLGSPPREVVGAVSAAVLTMSCGNEQCSSLLMSERTPDQEVSKAYQFSATVSEGLVSWSVDADITCLAKDGAVADPKGAHFSEVTSLAPIRLPNGMVGLVGTKLIKIDAKDSAVCKQQSAGRTYDVVVADLPKSPLVELPTGNLTTIDTALHDATVRDCGKTDPDCEVIVRSIDYRSLKGEDQYIPRDVPLRRKNDVYSGRADYASACLDDDSRVIKEDAYDTSIVMVVRPVEIADTVIVTTMTSTKKTSRSGTTSGCEGSEKMEMRIYGVDRRTGFNQISHQPPANEPTTRDKAFEERPKQG